MFTSPMHPSAPALMGTACFSITAVSDPAALPRVLEVFTKLGRAPYQCHAQSLGAGLAGETDDLHIDLQFQNMDRSEGEHWARALRACVLVKSVLTSQKQARMSA